MNKRPTFEQAKVQYVNRFTMEHIPQWARTCKIGDRYPAPQYRTDQEWYDNATFPGEPGHIGGRKHCCARNESWPMGQTLAERFTGVQS